MRFDCNQAKLDMALSIIGDLERKDNIPLLRGATSQALGKVSMVPPNGSWNRRIFEPDRKMTSFRAHRTNIREINAAKLESRFVITFPERLHLFKRFGELKRDLFSRG